MSGIPALTRATRCGAAAAIAVCLVLAGPLAAPALPALEDPEVGTLELVTPSAAAQAQLNQIDGLAFDAFGNLIGVREITGSSGGVVAIDKVGGSVVTLITGISRADQVALHPSGDLFVTSEVSGAELSDRIYRIQVAYGPGQTPVSAGTTSTSLVTTLAIAKPEGLVVLQVDGDFGNAGDLLTCEDAVSGDIFRVEPGTGATTILAAGLARPEGLAFGDFGGESAAGLFVAETSLAQVSSVDPNGVLAKFGLPASVQLSAPDNVEFGPDGFLYVTEDRPSPDSRVLRIASDGTHSVFATGFGQASGLAFDPANGDLYIAEQDLDRVWRVTFAPEASGAAAVLASLLPITLLRHRRRRVLASARRSTD